MNIEIVFDEPDEETGLWESNNLHINGENNTQTFIWSNGSRWCVDLGHCGDDAEALILTLLTDKDAFELYCFEHGDKLKELLRREDLFGKHLQVYRYIAGRSCNYTDVYIQLLEDPDES